MWGRQIAGMYPDIQDRDDDSTALAALELLKELVWAVPLVFAAIGYYVLEFRGWNLAFFIAMCVLGSVCLAIYSIVEFRERRAKGLKAKPKTHEPQ